MTISSETIKERIMQLTAMAFYVIVRNRLKWISAENAAWYVAAKMNDEKIYNFLIIKVRESAIDKIKKQAFY